MLRYRIFFKSISARLNTVMLELVERISRVCFRLWTFWHCSPGPIVTVIVISSPSLFIVMSFRTFVSHAEGTKPSLLSGARLRSCRCSLSSEYQANLRSPWPQQHHLECSLSGCGIKSAPPVPTWDLMVTLLNTYAAHGIPAPGQPTITNTRLDKLPRPVLT